MITYSLDTIKPMIDLLSDKENLSYELVDRILEYKDYQFEIERYKERISKDEYIDYLLSGDTDNECLKLHDNLYRDLYNDVQKYQKGIDELVIFLKSGALNKLLDELSKCFYNGIKLCDFHFIFTLGFGHSFGYVYKNIIHIDFLELIYTGIENVMNERVFLHEMHHIVFNTIPKNINSLEEEFILSFASEGLALKYVNNAKGNYSKPLKDEDMKGVDEFSINYLNNDFENTYFHFVDTIYKIRNNQMNKADLNKDKKSFWLNQKIDGKVVLKQSRYCSLGNELGGLLHDFYGIEKVYEIVQNPSMFLSCLNKVWIQLKLSKYIIDERTEAILETSRLTLKKMTYSTFDDLCLILQDEVTMTAYEHAFSDMEVSDWITKQLERYKNDGVGLWCVYLKDTSKLIGQCGITIQEIPDKKVYEIGYLFNRDYWRNGYAIEAAKACKEYVFDVLNIDEVYSIIRDINTASINVAIRNGMEKTGEFIKHYQGIDMPHYIYRVKREK